MQRSRAALGGTVIVLSLIAAACGGDDSDGATGTTTAAAPSSTTETTEAAQTTTTAAGDAPASMEEWEELWAAERAAVVERIESEGWGVSEDGDTLVGPAGFTIDLAACGSGWSDTEGLSDTTIKIGHTIPMSGAVGDYGNSTHSNQLVFDYYSDAGAFTDSEGKTRRIEYIVKDDVYDPARTIPLVDELIDSEKVFMNWALGSPPNLKIYDKLNERCIPQPFVQTSHPAFGDPVNHPWTVGAVQLSYTSEAIMWGAFLEQRVDEFPEGEKIKVAALIMNNDFGKVYDAGFRAYLEESPIKDRIDYFTETSEPQAPSLTDPMTTLAAKDPDVFIAMVAAGVCTQALTEAAQNGMHDNVTYLFQPGVCVGTGYVGRDKVGGDGSAAEGWWLVNPGLRDVNDPSQVDEPFIAWARELLISNGIDPKASSSYGTGFQFSWPLVQVLRIAGELEGGLTRTNLILATRAIEMTHPYVLPGIKFALNGNDDAFAAEGGVFQQWNSADQVWETKGNVIDLNGRSRNCAWDAASSVCG